MKQNHLYEKGYHYEALMLRAYKTIEKSTRKGTKSGIHETLVNYENGTTLYRQSSYVKELELVRTFLIKAMNEFLKRKLTPDQRMNLEDVKLDLVAAQSTGELDDLIMYALDVTQPYRKW